jgi:hypothetical protein
MKVKMNLFAGLLILAGTIVNAQSKTSFGIRGGVNLYNITGKEADGDKLENSLKTGFNIGVNAEIPVGIDFYLQPGVIFTTKGAEKFMNTQNKVSINYVEVPINFIYKPELGSGKLILGVGPYFAIGVGGNYKFDNGNDDLPIKFKNEITLAEAVALDNYYFKGFDAGANLLFGYEWANRFSVQLNAGLGLVDIFTPIENVDPQKSSQKNTGFGLSVGYRFAK